MSAEVKERSLLEDTVELLGRLDEDQIKAVHSIIVELSIVHEKRISPLGIETEEQMWKHIDRSLAQAKAGEGRDADAVADDLMREYAV